MRKDDFALQPSLSPLQNNNTKLLINNSCFLINNSSFFYMITCWEFTDWEPNFTRPLTPFERVELQPSEVCPKNFIIFDWIDNQSRIMFHPAMANKFSGPGLNVHANYNRDSEKNKANPVEGELSSPFEEDSEDIDALLSLEGEELEDHDEEELSTVRTNENYESICLVDINGVRTRVRKILWC